MFKVDATKKGPHRKSLDSQLKAALKIQRESVRVDYVDCARLHKHGYLIDRRVQRIVDHPRVIDFAASNESQGLVIHGNEDLDLHGHVNGGYEFSPISYFPLAYENQRLNAERDLVLVVFSGRHRTGEDRFDNPLNGVIHAARSLIFQLYWALGYNMDLALLQVSDLIAGIKSDVLSAFSDTLNWMLQNLGQTNCKCNITFVIDSVHIYESSRDQWAAFIHMMNAFRKAVRKGRAGEFGDHITFKWICVHPFVSNLPPDFDQHFLQMHPFAEPFATKEEDHGGVWKAHHWQTSAEAQVLPASTTLGRLLSALCNDTRHIIADCLRCCRYSAREGTPARQESKTMILRSDEYQRFNSKSNGFLIIENTYHGVAQSGAFSTHSWLLPYLYTAGKMKDRIVLTFVAGQHYRKFDMTSGIPGLLRSFTHQLLLKFRRPGFLDFVDEDMLGRVKNGHPDDLCELFRTVILNAQEDVRHGRSKSCNISCVIDGMQYLEAKYDRVDGRWKTFAMFRNLVAQTQSKCINMKVGFKIVFLHSGMSEYAVRAPAPSHQRLKLPTKSPEDGEALFAGKAQVSRSELGAVPLADHFKTASQPKEARAESTPETADIEHAYARVVAQMAKQESQWEDMLNDDSQWPELTGCSDDSQLPESTVTSDEPGQMAPDSHQAFTDAAADQVVGQDAGTEREGIGANATGNLDGWVPQVPRSYAKAAAKMNEVAQKTPANQPGQEIPGGTLVFRRRKDR